VSPLRGLWALSRAHCLEAVRSKTALFWTLAFPLVFLLVFAVVFGRGKPENVTFLLPGLLTISTLSGSFFGVTMQMIVARENGSLRRLRATPVTAATVVLSYAFLATATLAASFLEQVVAAKLLFGANVLGAPFKLGAIGLVGFAAFVPLGLFVGSAAKDSKSAPAITNLIFFPTMFVSGAAFPFFLLPEWLQRLARLLPATYLVDALQGVLVRGDGWRRLMPHVLVLLLTSGVGVFLNALLFRWESSERIPRYRLLVALGTLALFLVAIALLGPPVSMSVTPAGARAA
jgi:ABC-2 type transport system permease protein